MLYILGIPDICWPGSDEEKGSEPAVLAMDSLTSLKGRGGCFLETLPVNSGGEKEAPCEERESCILHQAWESSPDMVDCDLKKQSLPTHS